MFYLELIGVEEHVDRIPWNFNYYDVFFGGLEICLKLRYLTTLIFLTNLVKYNLLCSEIIISSEYFFSTRSTSQFRKIVLA